jgi:tetratricopeptide (TPR) repeat protein
MSDGSGSEVSETSDMAEFLDDFATDSDTEEPLPQFSVAVDRPWTAKTAAPDHLRADRQAESDEDEPWAPDLDLGGVLPPALPQHPACAVAPVAALEAVLATLDGAAARRLLAAHPTTCSAAAQRMVLGLCDGDYGGVLAAAPACQLLGLPSDATAGALAECVSLPEDLREEGNQLFTDGDFHGAISRYSSAIAQLGGGADSTDACMRCHLNRAACYLKMGHNLAAVADCAAVLAAPRQWRETNSTSTAKAFFRRAQAYKHLAAYSKATSDFTAALQLAPKDAVGNSGTSSRCLATAFAVDSRVSKRRHAFLRVRRQYGQH